MFADLHIYFGLADFHIYLGVALAGLVSFLCRISAISAEPRSIS